MFFVFMLCYLLFQPITMSVQHELPEPFTGHWKGQLHIFSEGKLVDSIPMSLVILPEDSLYTYVLTYNAERKNADRREYQLLHQEGNHFLLDEKNGIFIDTYLVDNCLMSHFEVMKSRIATRICLDEDNLNFEIIGFGADGKVSGGTTVDEQDIPEVIAYPVGQVTRAVLRKDE
jgi:hypothetical protein